MYDWGWWFTLEAHLVEDYACAGELFDRFIWSISRREFWALASRLSAS